MLIKCRCSNLMAIYGPDPKLMDITCPACKRSLRIQYDPGMGIPARPIDTESEPDMDWRQAWYLDRIGDLGVPHWYTQSLPIKVRGHSVLAKTYDFTTGYICTQPLLSPANSFCTIIDHNRLAGARSPNRGKQLIWGTKRGANKSADKAKSCYTVYQATY